jgi:methylmalonyl-CoA/ethylmalonyl-CoA epimerase
MKIDHLGIAVPNLTEALAVWEPILGVRGSSPEAVESQKVRVSFLEMGDSHLELLEATEPTSAVGRFVAERGGGLHHIAFHVPSVDAMLRAVAEKGYRLIDTVSRPGARGRWVGFVHPKSFHGVLVEFVEGA